MKNTILLIGAGSAIGKAITERLSQKGSTVLAGSRNPESLPRLSGVEYFRFDPLKDDPGSITMPETLHGFVYCPGTIRLRPFNRLKAEEFEEDFRINVMGAVRTLQVAISSLKRADSASAVLFSTVAVQTGMPFHASVASAKGAIEGLARSLAAEYAPKVRFNVIAPSLVETPLSGQLLSSDKKREASAQRHPLKRFGGAGDIAETALFLLGPESSWMSGQIIRVDGGMSALRTF